MRDPSISDIHADIMGPSGVAGSVRHQQKTLGATKKGSAVTCTDTCYWQVLAGFLLALSAVMQFS